LAANGPISSQESAAFECMQATTIVSTPATRELAKRVTRQKQTSRVRLTLSPEAEKYAKRDAPIGVRRMAARGALPLQPIDLATVLFALAHDADPEVKETARSSLESLPENVLATVVSGPANPALLSHFARVHHENEAVCEALALNSATNDATIGFLASLPIIRVVEIISNNQERMLRCDEIVEALGSNPLTSRSVIERILSFLGVHTSEEEDEEFHDDLTEEDAEKAVLAALGEEMNAVAKLLASEDDIEDKESQGNLFAAIQNMTVMQKIKLARIGGKEARTLLIKDRNKVVSSAVLASPKLTETEVVGIAQSRSVSDDILRQISHNKEWTRTYQVKLALSCNPKTPQPQALKFLNYLQDRDLRNLMKSKDVPSVISTHARRILTKRGKL
jgi:hypothetical protein